MNVSRPLAAITDGLSQTVVASEGKVQTPVAGNCFGSASNGSMLFPPLTNPNAIPDPNSSMPIIQSIYSSCLQRGVIGHTDWTYANSIYDGFTTALPPNTKVLVAPGVDLDVNTEDENNGGPTYAAVTARSYHPAASIACAATATAAIAASSGITIRYRLNRACQRQAGARLVESAPYGWEGAVRSALREERVLVAGCAKVMAGW